MFSKILGDGSGKLFSKN
uniref:Uncharacterized protein n=1 Tax=Lepeophtheirus salmonis TaxID=72036 RepID=A0A0K2T6Y1_LEPSM